MKTKTPLRELQSKRLLAEAKRLLAEAKRLEWLFYKARKLWLRATPLSVALRQMNAVGNLLNKYAGARRCAPNSETD